MKSAHIPLTLSLLLSLHFASMGQKTRISEPGCNGALRLPEAVQVALKRIPDVTVSCRVKPVMIQGDFDGDGSPDYAVLVIQPGSKKRGFLIVFGNGRTVTAGAGRQVKYGAVASSDLNFDRWELYSKNRPVESAKEQDPLTHRGDALLVSYQESASGLFYWDGKRICWYQQGD